MKEVLRNVPEQVLQNSKDILYLKETGTTANLNIKVSGQYETYADLDAAYPAESYLDDNPGSDYGAAYAVGNAPPHNYVDSFHMPPDRVHSDRCNGRSIPTDERPPLG